MKNYERNKLPVLKSVLQVLQATVRQIQHILQKWSMKVDEVKIARKSSILL